MKNQSIVIDREYGSGGREVARILSEKLGMEFFDGNLLAMAGREYGIDLSVIQSYDEKGVGGILADIAMMANPTNPGIRMEEAYSVFSAQSRLVQQLVARKPCIFLGRCTARILKTEAHVLFVHVFVYASNMQDRIDRARKVDGVDIGRIEAYIRRRDSERKNYNKFFTETVWGDPKNYDLMLNTSTLGYEAAAEAVIAVLRAKSGIGEA